MLTSKQKILFDTLYTPLIGEETTIISSKNPTEINIKGLIVDETSKFLILLVNDQLKQFYKNNITIQITSQGKPLNIDGRFLFTTLQTRLKKLK